MSMHPIVASFDEEAHLRTVLNSWQAERAISRTGLSKLLTGTDVLLPFWNGTRRISQPVINRILIGCRAAGIEATLDTLLGARQPMVETVLPPVDEIDPMAKKADWDRLFSRIDELETIYDAMMFIRKLETLEGILEHFSTRLTALEVRIGGSLL